MILSLLLRLLLYYYFTTTTSQFSGHFLIEQHSWLESYALSVYTTSSTQLEVHACDASRTNTETLSDLGLNLTTTPMPFRHANLYMALNVVHTGRGQKKMHTVELLRRATRKKCVGRTDKHTFSAARLPGWRMTVHSTQRHSPSSAIGARS